MQRKYENPPSLVGPDCSTVTGFLDAFPYKGDGIFGAVYQNVHASSKSEPRYALAPALLSSYQRRREMRLPSEYMQRQGLEISWWGCLSGRWLSNSHASIYTIFHIILSSDMFVSLHAHTGPALYSDPLRMAILVHKCLVLSEASSLIYDDGGSHNGSGARACSSFQTRSRDNQDIFGF